MNQFLYTVDKFTGSISGKGGGINKDVRCEMWDHYKVINYLKDRSSIIKVS